MSVVLHHSWQVLRRTGTDDETGLPEYEVVAEYATEREQLNDIARRGGEFGDWTVEHVVTEQEA